MTPQSPGNPARALEKFAVATVSAWVGTGGTVEDTSVGHLPDFRIDYIDGRSGIGEVGWHQDPALAAMWGGTLKSDHPQQISLPTGCGQWGVGLKLGANIKKLHKELPAAIQTLRDNGVSHVDVDYLPPGGIADTLLALGIEYLHCVSLDDPANAIFFMPGGGGSAGDDPNQIAEWFDLVLSDTRYADTTQKLLAVHADERHVFLGMGGLTPYVMEHNLRIFSSSALPTQIPNAPAGITHIWGIGQFGGEAAALWSADRGWSAIPLPDPT